MFTSTLQKGCEGDKRGHLIWKQMRAPSDSDQSLTTQSSFLDNVCVDHHHHDRAVITLYTGASMCDMLR